MTLKDSGLKLQGRHSDTNTCNSGARKLVHFEAREQIFLCYAFLSSFVRISFLKSLNAFITGRQRNSVSFNNSHFHADILVTGNRTKCLHRDVQVSLLSIQYLHKTLSNQIYARTRTANISAVRAVVNTHGSWSHQRWVIIHHFAVSQPDLIYTCAHTQVQMKIYTISNGMHVHPTHQSRRKYIFLMNCLPWMSFFFSASLSSLGIYSH